MHYIICGIEHIGLKIVKKLLALDVAVTVITKNEQEHLLEQIKEKVFRHVIGDARQSKVLEAAGIRSADVFMILTGSDVTNIEIHLTARELNPQIGILTNLQNEESLSQEIAVGFDITKAINISEFTAPAFVSACLHPAILHMFSYRGKNFFVGRMGVEKDSENAGKTIADIEKREALKVLELKGEDGSKKKLDCHTVLKVGDQIKFLTYHKHFLAWGQKYEEENNEFIPKQGRVIRKQLEKLSQYIPKNIRIVMLLYGFLILFSTIFYQKTMDLSLLDAFYFVITTTSSVGYGDINLKSASVLPKLYGTFMMIAGTAVLAAFFTILAEYLIRKRFEQFLGTSKYQYKNHIILAGIGGMGYRVANQLQAYGAKVVVIDKNHENSYLKLLHEEIDIIYGDAQYGSILFKAGITRAKTIAALVNDDMKNLNIILKAKKLNRFVESVTRIFNPKIEAVMAEQFAIEKVYSTSELAMPLFIAAALYKNTCSAFETEAEIYVFFEADASNIRCLGEKTEAQLRQEFGIVRIGAPFVENPFEGLKFSANAAKEEKRLYFGTYAGLKDLLLGTGGLSKGQKY